MFTYTIPSIFTDGIGKIGTVGYVNLNVPYTPFGLTKTDDWKKDSKNLSKYFGFNDNVPKWVIRNGVNNEAQNARTNYGSTEMPSGSNDTGVNWNGAVGFTVEAVQSKPSGGGTNWEDPNFPKTEFPNYTPFTLTLSPGGWSSKPVTGSAVVLFDTGGDYDGLANWYYVVKESTDPDPLLSEFTTKGTHKAVKGQDANGNDIETPVVVSGIAKDTEFRAWIEIPNYSSSKEYAVWVILEKDWTTSQPICIEEKLLAWETTVDF
jgi:hypothetical protein